MEEQNKGENKKENSLKQGFFKKVWYSITKIEKYPDMAAEGVGRTIGYLAKLVAVFSIVFCLGMMYCKYKERFSSCDEFIVVVIFYSLMSIFIYLYFFPFIVGASTQNGNVTIF